MTENIEQKFADIINSGALVNVELFNINDSYIELEKSDFWVIDGGIQFTFPKGIIQIGWNPEIEIFMFSTNDIKDNVAEYEYKELTKGKIHRIHNLRGKNVLDFDLKTISFEVWDDDADDFIEKKTLVEMFLVFDSKEKIQILTADYQLNEEEEPINIQYDLMSGLFIILGERMMIEDVG